MLGTAFYPRMLTAIALMQALNCFVLAAQRDTPCPKTSLEEEPPHHQREAQPRGGLQIVGDRDYLQQMLNQWAEGFAAAVSLADDGTVNFDVAARDVAGSASATLLYELVKHRKRFVFYVGVDHNTVAALFEGTCKSSLRRRLFKLFSGEGFATGGRHVIGTKGRAHALQPAGDVFAVIALNANADIQQIAISEHFAEVAPKEQEVGLGHLVPLASLFIHEAAENLDFAAQQEQGRRLNYRAAHVAAMQREAEIVRQRRLPSGFAGGFLQIKGAMGFAGRADSERRRSRQPRFLRSIVGLFHRSARLLRGNRRETRSGSITLKRKPVPFE